MLTIMLPISGYATYYPTLLCYLLVVLPPIMLPISCYDPFAITATYQALPTTGHYHPLHKHLRREKGQQCLLPCRGGNHPLQGALSDLELSEHSFGTHPTIVAGDAKGQSVFVVTVPGSTSAAVRHGGPEAAPDV